MGELRDRMVRDMDVRRFSGRTIESYLAGVKGLAKYYRRPPDALSDAEVQHYLLHLREPLAALYNIAPRVRETIIVSETLIPPLTLDGTPSLP
ncbi:MAG: phage integrase N-terminal SAM-like domain-containing protein, partial [Gemmatimonadetes bacterium]|nr:phage integrase N-terminal SAM-like domain-containing protein [Gemmatimonadota bacterium]